MPAARKRATATGRNIVVRPVTNDNWEDFVRLFESKGGPHHCWCTAYRVRESGSLGKSDKKSHMAGLVDNATPIGVLAYDGEEPVGWCSMAPRETYIRLEKSRTMPRVTPPAVSTWTILCFFVPRPRRQQGLAQTLLKGAVAYAKQHGAKVVEGYPFDTMGISSTHRGHSHVFGESGFQQDGKRWARSLRGG
jgi:hypothetical protein